MEERVDGLLYDKTRPPGKRPLAPKVVRRVVELTHEEPPGEATHWTVRAMAKAAAISKRSVQRIWAAHGLAEDSLAPNPCRDPRRPRIQISLQSRFLTDDSSGSRGSIDIRDSAQMNSVAVKQI